MSEPKLKWSRIVQRMTIFSQILVLLLLPGFSLLQGGSCCEPLSAAEQCATSPADCRTAAEPMCQGHIRPAQCGAAQSKTLIHQQKLGQEHRQTAGVLLPYAQLVGYDPQWSGERFGEMPTDSCQSTASLQVQHVRLQI